ncbi:MAG: 3-hydroxyacyl-ACP dehydratase FabZ [Actinomycetota bacterium]
MNTSEGGRSVEDGDVPAGDVLPEPISLLPHRPPFLLVDELLSLVPGERVVGRWHITGEEWFLPGHFPGRPTVPGVLLVESLAQVGACALLADERFTGKLPLFGGADKVKFRRQVVPGETLELTVEMGRLGSRAGKGTGRATVDGEMAAQLELMFVLVDP